MMYLYVAVPPLQYINKSESIRKQSCNEVSDLANPLPEMTTASRLAMPKWQASRLSPGGLRFAFQTRNIG